MTGEHLEAILKTAHSTKDKDGWLALPDGGMLTFYVSHDGVGLTVSRVEAVRTEGEIVYARTPKREVFALERTDIYAVALEGAAGAGAPVRRAGFG